MRTNPLLRKGIAVVVIALLLALAFAPSINANVSKEDELVEITTEICGLPGLKPQTIQLTKEDAEAVDRLFEETKVKLDSVETREEAVEIFIEVIVELDKYGILGDLTIKEAQRLVTGRFQKSKGITHFDAFINRLNKFYDFNFSNLFCLVFTNIKDTDIRSIEGNFYFILGVALWMNGFEQIGEWLMNYGWKKPIRILDYIGLMNLDDSKNISVYSIGLLGFKNNVINYENWLRIYGFTGIIIKPDFENWMVDIRNIFFLGCAIGTKGPELIPP